MIAGFRKLQIPGIAMFFAVLNQAAPASSQYIRTDYGPSSGIPLYSANRITQSRQGFLWMAGGNSRLVRFDGQSFYEVPAPLADAVALAPNGDLWLTRTRPATLMRIAAQDLDRFGDLPFTSYPFDTGTPAALQYLQFGRDGTLWLAASLGIYRFDNGKFVAVISRPDISRFEEASSGHLLLATTQGCLE